MADDASTLFQTQFLEVTRLSNLEDNIDAPFKSKYAAREILVKLIQDHGGTIILTGSVEDSKQLLDQELGTHSKTLLKLVVPSCCLVLPVLAHSP